jgi:tetratricopeptide (TPR) repeat protein
LRPYEQTALAQCAVFRGGFSFEAAEEILDLSAHPQAAFVVDVLQDLCDRSMLYRYEPAEVPGEPRFAVYQSIREYAQERLSEAGGALEAAARHACYYLRVCEAWNQQIDGPAGEEARRRLFLEMENLLAVHRRAVEAGAAEEALKAVVALGPTLYSRGPYGLYLSLLDAALKTAPPAAVDALLRAKAIHARGRTQQFLGRMAESRADYDQALSLAEAAGDKPFIARVLYSVANHSYWQGKLPEAREAYAKALALNKELGDLRSEGLVYGSLAVLEQEQGNLGQAWRYLSDAIRLHREAGDKASEGWTLGNFASFEQEQGHLSEARRYLEQALVIQRALGNRRSEAMHLANLAMIEQEQGELTRARGYFEGALTLAKEIGHRRFEGVFAGYLGRCEEEAGRLEEALKNYEQALKIHREMGNRAYEALITAYLGGLYATRGDIVAAEEALDAAEAKLAELKKPVWSAVASLGRGLLDVAAARATSDAEGRRHLAQSAARRLEEARSLGAKSADVRGAVRLLARALDAALPKEPVAPRPSAADALIVGDDALWFRMPNQERVSLQKRRALRLILKKLSEERRRTPGAPVPLATLFESGWPNERVHPEAAKSRLYMALCTLRNLGLRDVLVRQDNGYLLDPKVPLFEAEEREGAAR